MKSPALAVLLILMGAAALAAPPQLPELFKRYGFKEGLVRPPKGLLKHDYLVPEHAGSYYQLFDWDIYFIGLDLSYDGVGKPLADSIKNFLDYVDDNSNAQGYVPREIAPEGFWALPEMVKPFLAQEAVLSSRVIGDYKWIEPYYERLKHTVSYWEDARRAPDGLFVWYNGEESGVDNNPAVSDVPSLVSEGVDLQVYVYREYQALAVIARKLGKPEDEKLYGEKAKALGALIQSRMWSQADGMYLNIDARTGKPVRVKTWTNLLPLWIGLPDAARAKAMIEKHLLNSAEFWSVHGVRTVSRGEKAYDPVKGYWRGPVWAVSNYLMMRGLLNYGYKKEARALADATVDVLTADILKTKGMNECYNPETGEPAGEGNFLDWDLLAERMPQEAAGGADPTALTP